MTVLAGGSAASAKPAKKAAFPDGSWLGKVFASASGSIFEGSVSESARVDFDLSVEDGTVTGGSLDFSGSGQSRIAGGSANLTFTGEGLKLSGTAQAVRVSGPFQISGTATTGGFTVPINFSTTTDFSFSPSSGSCSQVTGDFVQAGRQAAESIGFRGSIRGDFVAVRTGDAPTAEQHLDDYDDLVADLLPDDKRLSVKQLLKLAERAERMHARLLGTATCDPKAAKSFPNFKRGVGDTLLALLFQGLVDDVLGRHEELTAQELLAVLGTGVRMGAVGPRVPDGDLRKEAANLFRQFEATLELKLNRAKASGDDAAIEAILIGAQQYGLDSLANKAKAALAKVVGP